jgi:hypothetical protein
MIETEANRHMVDRCLTGDEQAWVELFDRCHQRLEKVIQRQLGPPLSA